MVNLDDIKYDQSGQKEIATQIEHFGEDCRAAWHDSKSIIFPKEYLEVNNVVLLGMGGSGIAGETIKGLLYNSKYPVEVVHDYDLPGYVNEKTLVIASSHSGNTEETVSGFKDAIKLKAKVFAITTGGQLAELAANNDSPKYIYNYTSQPRLAFPYLFIPLLQIFKQLGIDLVPRDFDDICNDVSEINRKYKASVSLSDNYAKSLAQKIYGKIPIIQASRKLQSSARRLKNQIHENAKSLAWAETYPELDHNLIEGYQHPQTPVILLTLCSSFDTKMIKLRQKITTGIIDKNNGEQETVDFNNVTDELTEILFFATLADSLTFYLALLERVDPAQVPNIKNLKEQL